MSRAADAFLDQLVTWRELGYNMCARRTDYDRYETLPGWARATFTAHARDPRPIVYTRDRFEAADTHDALWNAAQTELVLGTFYGVAPERVGAYVRANTPLEEVRKDLLEMRAAASVLPQQPLTPKQPTLEWSKITDKLNARTK